MNEWIFELTICGTLVLTGLCAVSWWIRTSPAAIRHAVWVTGLIGLLALAFMLAMLPRLNVVPNPYSQWATNNPAVHAAATDGSVVTQTNIEGSKFPPIAAEEHSIASKSPESTSAAWPAIHRMTPAGSLDHSTVVGTIWLTGCFLALARLLLAGFWLFRTARKGERCNDAAVLAEVLSCAAKLGYSRRLRLYISDDDTMPMCWGIVNPSLRLPQSIIEGSSNELRAVLLHEIGHLARRDPSSQLLVQFAGAMFWFHPLLWYALRQCNATRESACDDLVLNAGVAPEGYARCLLNVVATGGLPRLAGGVGIAMSRTSQMEDRIRAVMSRTCDRRPMGRHMTIWLALAIITCLLPLAILRGQEPPAADTGDVAAKPAPQIDDLEPTVEPAPTSEEHATANSKHELRASGRVMTADGAPIAGARVMSEAQIDKVGRTFISRRTDENGKYTLTYRKSDGDWPPPMSWVYADGYELLGLTMLSVFRSPGPVENIDIYLKPAETITYQIRNPDGTPAVDAIIVPNTVRMRLGQMTDGTFAIGEYFSSNFLPTSLIEIIGQRSDENGQVTLTGIAADSFNLVDVSSTRFGLQRFGVSGGEKDLQFGDAGEIRGRVEMDSPDLVAGTTVRIHTRTSRNEGGFAEVELDAQGQFHVPAIAAGGIASVYIDWDPDLPVHPYLDLRNHRSVVAGQTLDLVIETRRTVKANGQILTADDRIPVAGATAVLNGLSSPLNGVRAKTGDDGRFSIRVTPGIAIQQVVSLGDDMVFARKYESPSLDRVTIPEDVEEFELSPYLLPRRLHVQVELRDTSGKPIEGETVGFHVPQTGHFLGYGTTDEFGKFETQISGWRAIRKIRSTRDNDPYQWSIVGESKVIDGRKVQTFERLNVIVESDDRVLLSR